MSELEALARDRPLVTGEIFAPNAWYGHARALKRYAGLPDGASLKVAIEHGPWLDDEIWEIDAGTPMPRYLCAAPWRARYFEEQTGKPATAVGPLISYVDQPEPPDFDHPHLLVFPAHSSHHVDALYDERAFVRLLETIRSDYESVTICVYWRDVLRGVAGVFAEAGYPCVTAGHLYDPDFLPRLAGLIGGATHVLTNEIGTHVLYSAHFGRAVWIVRQEVLFQQSADSDLQDVPLQDLEHPKIVALRDAFADRRATLGDDQRAIVDGLLGTDCVHTRAAMRDLLEDAEQAWAALPARTRAQARAVALARRGVNRARAVRA